MTGGRERWFRRKTSAGNAGSTVGRLCPPRAPGHSIRPATVEWHVVIQHNQLSWDLWYSTAGSNGPWTDIVMDLPPGAFNVGSVHTYDWAIPGGVPLIDVSTHAVVRCGPGGSESVKSNPNTATILP